MILDLRLRTPPTAAIFADVNAFPVLILTSETAARSSAAGALRAVGAEIVHVPTSPPVPRLAAPPQAVPTTDRIDLRAALHLLRARFATHTIMVEAGPRLLGSLFDQSLIDAAVVHTAPPPGQRSPAPSAIAPPMPFKSTLVLAHTHSIGADTEQFFLAR